MHQRDTRSGIFRTDGIVHFDQPAGHGPLGGRQPDEPRRPLPPEPDSVGVFGEPVACRPAFLDRSGLARARRDSLRLALILAGCALYLLGVASGALVRVLL